MSSTDNIPCSYKTWSLFSIFFSSCSILLSITFGILTFYHQRYKIHNKQIFYIFTSLSSLLLLIESIDPLSLFNIISPVIINILSNISTWLSIFLFAYFISSLIKIIEYKDLVNIKNLYVYLPVFISFIFTIIASAIQHKFPTWQGIKLIVFAITLLFFTISVDYYFYRIIKLFDRLNTLNEESSENKNKQWYLISFLSIYHIVILLVIIIQLYWGINLIINPIIDKTISWENILLFSLHIFLLILSEFFFLGKFTINFT